MGKLLSGAKQPCSPNFRVGGTKTLKNNKTVGVFMCCYVVPNRRGKHSEKSMSVQHSYSAPSFTLFWGTKKGRTCKDYPFLRPTLEDGH